MKIEKKEASFSLPVTIKYRVLTKKDGSVVEECDRECHWFIDHWTCRLFRGSLKSSGIYGFERLAKCRKMEVDHDNP